jgi:hypothetical protein
MDRLRRVLEHCNISLPAKLEGLAAREAGRAAGRCETCLRKTLCDEWLAAGDANAYRGFCPNAHYIAQVRTHRLA